MAPSQVSKLLFGDEEVIFNMPSSMLQTEKTFVPVESEHKGYWVQVESHRVIVTRRNPWQAISGLLPIYRFVGRLPEPHQVVDVISVPGIVGVKPAEKAFLLAWFGLLLIFMTISLVQAIFLAGKVIFSSNFVPIDDLATIGFMLRGGALVAALGIAVLGIVRLIFRGQRHGLIAFCVHQGSKASASK